MANYEQTLQAAKSVGASHANNEEMLALFCDGPLQILCGAVSPSLVWQGAKTKNLTYSELAHLAATDPTEVADLMWV